MDTAPDPSKPFLSSPQKVVPQPLLRPSSNPFSAAIDAKRTFLALFPSVPATVILGSQGPFLAVTCPARLALPTRVNGFKVVRTER